MKIRKLAAVLLAFALVVAACGDDDDVAPTQAPTPPPPAATDAPAPPPAATDAPAPPPAATDAPAPPPATAPPIVVPPDVRAEWPDTLVFGFVPSRQSEELQDNVNIFADVLSKALGIRVVGVVTTDYTGLGVALGTGQADMGAFGPQGYVLASRQYDNLELLAQSVRFGDATYHTQFFTNDPGLCTGPPVEGTFYYDDTGAVIPVGATESPQLQVGFLSSDGVTPEEGTDIGLRCPEPVPLTVIAGKTMSWVSETSTSGFLIPTLELEALGITADQYTSIFSTASHDGSVLNVYNGDADVGVSFNDARRNVRKTNPDVGSKVIVFNITGRIANDVIAVNDSLPQSLKDALFLAMSNYIATPEGRKVMDDVYSWTDLIRANQATIDSLVSIGNAIDALAGG